MKSTTVTAKILVEKGACRGKMRLFRRLFGKSARVTLRECVRVAHQFDWDWAANNLLSAPARKAYQEATATAWKAYQEATAPARKAYQEAIIPSEKAYQEATAPAEKAYQEARAIAFARCVKEWGIAE